MIIDENYPGLEEKGNCYHYKKDICVDTSLFIKVPLHCDGYIDAKNIEAVGDINCLRGVTSRQNITVKGSLCAISFINARGWLKVGDNISTKGQIHAGKYIEGDGCMYAGSSIETRGYISAKTSISADAFIDAAGSIEAGSFIQACSYIHSRKFIKAMEYIHSGGRIKKKEYVSLDGIKSKVFYNIIGRRWNITVMDTHLRIGCEFHSREKWAQFSNAEITLMDHGALTWWKNNKEWVLSLK